MINVLIIWCDPKIGSLWPLINMLWPLTSQVYERASWTTLHMSRAQNARCNKKQEALDYQMAGTGLMLEMIENERLCKCGPILILYNLRNYFNTCRFNSFSVPWIGSLPINFEAFYFDCDILFYWLELVRLCLYLCNTCCTTNYYVYCIVLWPSNKIIMQ